MARVRAASHFTCPGQEPGEDPDAVVVARLLRAHRAHQTSEARDIGQALLVRHQPFLDDGIVDTFERYGLTTAKYAWAETIFGKWRSAAWESVEAACIGERNRLLNLAKTFNPDRNPCMGPMLETESSFRTCDWLDERTGALRHHRLHDILDEIKATHSVVDPANLGVTHEGRLSAKESAPPEHDGLRDDDDGDDYGWLSQDEYDSMLAQAPRPEVLAGLVIVWYPRIRARTPFLDQVTDDYHLKPDGLRSGLEELRRTIRRMRFDVHRVETEVGQARRLIQREKSRAYVDEQHVQRMERTLSNRSAELARLEKKAFVGDKHIQSVLGVKKPRAERILRALDAWLRDRRSRSRPPDSP